jgi:hypothetical protein
MGVSPLEHKEDPHRSEFIQQLQRVQEQLMQFGCCIYDGIAKRLQIGWKVLRAVFGEGWGGYSSSR